MNAFTLLLPFLAQMLRISSDSSTARETSTINLHTELCAVSLSLWSRLLLSLLLSSGQRDIEVPAV